MTNYTRVHEAADVTDEVIVMIQSIYSGFFADGEPIDWDRFLDRLDGSELADGSKIDLSEDLTSPAVKKIKSEIRAYRKL